MSWWKKEDIEAKQTSIESWAKNLATALYSYKGKLCLDAKGQVYIFKEVTVATDDDIKVWIVVENRFSILHKQKTGYSIDEWIVDNKGVSCTVKTIAVDHQRWIDLEETLKLLGVELTFKDTSSR